MKKIISIILLSLFTLSFLSCSSDDGVTENAVFAVPIVKSLAKIRSEVSIETAQATNADGKIYVTENFLFYIAKESGIHIFNNENTSAPQNIAFINLGGVHDIAVKGNYLYADNFIDLVVFDISNIENITLVQTLENAIVFYVEYPTTSAEFYDYTISAGTDEIVTGYKLETRKRPDPEMYGIYTDALAEFDGNSGAPNSNGAVGTGGSYARFQINDNALYTVDSYQLNVFNISNPTNVFFDKSIYMNEWFFGGMLETLFKQKDFLFIGATDGMQIIDASDEFNPVFVSGFSHATACDPVVVQGVTAYITIRGGSTCGAIEDQINVIDITDIANPVLLSTTLLDQPFGLGIENDALYVCSGSGINVYDASSSAGLVLQNTYADNVTDVIPLQSHLIAVGNNKIIQYSYGSNFTLLPLSVVNF